jgi:hypothetical protein
MEESLAAVADETASMDDYLPKNPYTRRIFEKHPWRGLFNYWWRSSPAELVGKSRELLRERFRPE